MSAADRLGRAAAAAVEAAIEDSEPSRRKPLLSARRALVAGAVLVTAIRLGARPARRFVVEQARQRLGGQDEQEPEEMEPDEEPEEQSGEPPARHPTGRSPRPPRRPRTPAGRR